MRGLLGIACLLFAGLLFSPAPAEAAGRWVKSCNGRSCQMVWVEDRPAARPVAAKAACACPYCSCDEPGGKASSQCSRFNCQHQRSVLVPRAHQAVAGCSSCSSGSSSGGWYLGKTLGRGRPRWRE